MNYGEQRFLMYNQELTAEEKARQTLAIEAIKEQARYERKKRQKLAKKVKETGKMFMSMVTVILLGLILLALASCETPQPEIEECVTYDLGKAGETYTPIQVNEGGNGMGISGVVYIHNGRVMQEICTYE